MPLQALGSSGSSLLAGLMGFPAFVLGPARSWHPALVLPVVIYVQRLKGSFGSPGGALPRLLSDAG